ncbi:MAG: long-chain fatty acid--CoA ligase [Calditrichia bacterium]
MTGSDWLKKWAFYFPDKIAVREYETGREFSYRYLNELSERAASFFVRFFHLKKGDRLAVLAENCLEYFILFGMAQKTGVILVPLNYRLTRNELNFLLADSGPAVILCEDKFREKLPDSDVPVIRLEDFSEKLNLLNEPEVPAAEILESNPLFILYTSGTTGTPKGAIYTHGMLFWNSINTTLRLDIRSDDRSVSCTPMFHTGGWNVIPTPFLHRGATVTLMKKFDPLAVLEELANTRSTMFMAVPTMLQMMADTPIFEKVDLSAMRFFVIGGEPMPLPLIDRWHNKGIPIRQGYGLTEAGPSITSLHQDDAIRKRGSIGTPNFYLDIRIVNERGKDVPPGEVGELWLKGPSVTPGYWHNETATREALTDGWFHTGDMVRMDEDGYLFIMDRKKNMYISGGENVYPAEVEKVILAHPDVKEAAIIGVPDEKWGETGMAFLVMNEDKRITIEELTTFLTGKIAKYKLPRQLEIVSELPKNDTGKIDRKALKNLITQP